MRSQIGAGDASATSCSHRSSSGHYRHHDTSQSSQNSGEGFPFPSYKPHIRSDCQRGHRVEPVSVSLSPHATRGVRGSPLPDTATIADGGGRALSFYCLRATEIHGYVRGPTGVPAVTATRPISTCATILQMRQPWSTRITSTAGPTGPSGLLYHFRHCTSRKSSSPLIPRVFPSIPELSLSSGSACLQASVYYRPPPSAQDTELRPPYLAAASISILHLSFPL